MTQPQNSAVRPANVTEDGEVLEAVVRQTQTTLEEQFITEAGKENILSAYRLASHTERQKLLRGAVAEMTKLGWGGNISDATRGAIARWGLENDVDPLRHLDVMGNRLYANANYYYDKVAALGILARNEVEMMGPLISLDFSALPVSGAAKTALKAEAEDINARCISLQMQHRVPAALNDEGDAAASALVRLYWKDGTMTEGVNWAGEYKVPKKSKTGKEGYHDDPVGSESPTKTAITRAFRKAAMQKVSVHKFAKGDEGSPMSIVSEYIQADRDERHNQPELPPQASYVKPIDVPQLPAEPATEFQAIEAYTKETNAERDNADGQCVGGFGPGPDDAEVLSEDLELTGD